MTQVPVSRADEAVSGGDSGDRVSEGDRPNKEPVGGDPANKEPVGVTRTEKERVGDEKGPGESCPCPLSTTPKTQPSIELTPEEVERLMQVEKNRRKRTNGRRGRLQELEETRTELAQKQLELLQKEQELLDRDQSLAVLREEVRHNDVTLHTLNMM